MALLFCDGFELDFADGSQGLWDSVQYDATRGTLQHLAGGRSGNGYFWVNRQDTTLSDSNYITKTFTAQTEVYVGFGLFWNGEANPLGSVYIPFQLLSSGAVSQLYMQIYTTTGKLRFRQGDATVIGDTTAVIKHNVWHYIELHLVVNDSTGSLEVRLDGVSQFNQTGIDTNNGGGNVGQIRIGTQPDNIGAGGFGFDDVVVIDTSGSVTNSWPNGAGIQPLNFDGDGNYSAWTSTGVNDYTEVDEISSYGTLPDGDTTRLYSPLLNNRVSMTLDNTPTTGTVLGMMLLANAKQSLAGPDAIAHFLRISSTDYDQSSWTPSTSYGYQLDFLTASPATSVAFTTAEIDGMELGYKVA